MLQAVELRVAVIGDADEGLAVRTPAIRETRPVAECIVARWFHEVQGSVPERFLGVRAGADEDGGDAAVSGKGCGGGDVEGFVEPEVVHGDGAEDDGAGAELQWRDCEFLGGPGDALGDEPAGLEAGDGLGELVCFTLVEYLFLCDVGDANVLLLDEVVDLLSGHREGTAVRGREDESSTVCVKGMDKSLAFSTELSHVRQ